MATTAPTAMPAIAPTPSADTGATGCCKNAAGSEQLVVEPSPHAALMAPSVATTPSSAAAGASSDDERRRRAGAAASALDEEAYTTTRTHEATACVPALTNSRAGAFAEADAAGEVAKVTWSAGAPSACATACRPAHEKEAISSADAATGAGASVNGQERTSVDGAAASGGELALTVDELDSERVADNDAVTEIEEVLDADVLGVSDGVGRTLIVLAGETEAEADTDADAVDETVDDGLMLSDGEKECVAVNEDVSLPDIDDETDSLAICEGEAATVLEDVGVMEQEAEGDTEEEGDGEELALVLGEAITDTDDDGDAVIDPDDAADGEADELLVRAEVELALTDAVGVIEAVSDGEADAAVETDALMLADSATDRETL